MRALKWWLLLAACMGSLWAAPAALGASALTRPSAVQELARLAARSPRMLTLPNAHWHLQAARAHTAIVGGSSAAQGQWPYLAFVVYFDSSGNPVFSCSGAVISPEVVMTAGHCAVDDTTAVPLRPAGYVVVTGAADWTDTVNRQLSHVTSVQTAPGFDLAGPYNDASVLVLATPTTAPAIRLAKAYDQPLESAGIGAVIAGWGLEQQGGVTPTTLQWASTVVQDPTYCSSQFTAAYDPVSQLCGVNAPTYDTATCNGDSGSPLIAADSSGNPVSIGVTSYGPSDCNTSSADYFTTVRPMSGWTQGVITANTPAPPTPPPTPPTPTPSSSPPPTPPAPTSSPAYPPSKPPVLPRMSRADASSDAILTLAGVFKRGYKRGHGRQLSCRRQSMSKFGCLASFRYGPDFYWGTVDVLLVFGQGHQVFWSDHYVIHSVSDHCYFHTRHPQRCTVHTRKGVW